MKYSWILFTARRYFKAKQKEKSFASSILAVAGITVGVMTLISVLAVMNGFQLGFIENILEIGSNHVRLTSDSGERLPENMIESIRALDSVKVVSPFTESQTIGGGNISRSRGCLLKGVEPDIMDKDAVFRDKLVMSSGGFYIAASGSIVVGHELAYALGVTIGDTVALTSLTGPSFSLLKPQEVSFTITGIAKSGYYEYDSTMIWISLEDALTHFAVEREIVYGIKLTDRFQDIAAARQIASIIEGSGYSIETWREFNRSFFGALRMEKIMMMFLVGLIFLVVGVNIFNSLRRAVYERTEDIGIMKAIGAPPWAIQAIFVLEGLLIGVIGSAVGTAMGLLVSVNIGAIFEVVEEAVNVSISFFDQIAAFFSGQAGSGEFALYPSAYFYMLEIPSRIIFSEVLFIVLFAILSSTAAAVFASARVSQVKPTEVLRYE